MDIEQLNKMNTWATEALLAGNSVDSIKLMLKGKEIVDKDIATIILMSKKLINKKIRAQIKQNEVNEQSLVQIAEWNGLDKEVQNYILNQILMDHTHESNERHKEVLKVKGKWQGLYFLLIFLSAAGMAFSGIAFKERIFDDYEKIGVKVLILCWNISAVVFFFNYAIKFQDIMSGKIKDEWRHSLWEGVGFLQVVIIFIFFWYIAAESGYYKPLPFIYTLNVLFFILILYGSYVRREKLAVFDM